MPENRPTAIVYIDGLNLYRHVKATFPENQLLDVYRLSCLLLPDHSVTAVNYFTAITKNLAGNPDSNIRQNLYLKAIQRASETVSVQLGQIRINTRVYPVAPKQLDENGLFVKTKVFKFEEKETDVRIAAMMVADASEKLADHFLLVSSDSDFNPLIEMLTQRQQVSALQHSVKKITSHQIQLSQLT
jgi:uncharacterized LabA/DUF88 family protein